MTSFGVYRDNQVKISLPGSALIEYDWCPLKKGEIEHRDTHREKTDNGKRHKKKKTIQQAKKKKKLMPGTELTITAPRRKQVC